MGLGRHLDIIYAQCAEKHDGRKISYHIISRLGATVAQKVPQKLNYLQKWPNLQGRWH